MAPAMLDPGACMSDPAHPAQSVTDNFHSTITTYTMNCEVFRMMMLYMYMYKLSHY